MIRDFLVIIFILLITVVESYSETLDLILNIPKEVKLFDSTGKEKVAQFGVVPFVVEKVITGSTGLKYQRNKIVITISPNSILRLKDSNFYLEKGSVRIDFDQEKNQAEIAVQSDVSQMVVKKEGSYLVSYDSESARFDVLVFKGEGTIHPVGREDVLIIKEQCRGSFLGVMDSEGPAFDIFLKGHKAARGEFAAIEKLNSKDIELQLSKTQIATYIPPKPKVLKLKPNEICRNPIAKFNDCLWTCVNNPKKDKKCRVDLPSVYCERKRCNANGEWSETLRLPANAKYVCDFSTSRITSCDY